MNKKQKMIDRAVERFADSIVNCSDKTDFQNLAEFQKGVFSEGCRQANTDFTRWAFLHPVGGRLGICEKDGEIVGQQGELKTTLRVGEMAVPAAWAIDLRVLPEWKMKGLGVALIGTVIRSSDVVLALGISDEAKRMFSRQGWLDLGRVDAYIKPVSAQGLFRQKIEPSRLEFFFRKVASFGLRQFDRVIIAIGRLSRRSDAIEEFREFDQTFDEVIKKCLERSKITCDRSVAFFNWRFVNCPLGNEYRFYKAVDDGEIGGFVVLCRGRRNEKDTLVINELVATPGHDRDLLDFVVGEAYRHGVDAIYYQGLDPVIGNLLKRRMFISRSDGCRFMAYSRDPALGQELKNLADWRVSFADGDIGFSVNERQDQDSFSGL